MEEKYWPYINFIGRMETIQEDATRLLKQVGAWELFGKTGWGANGKDSIFQAKAGGVGRYHATNANSKLKSYFTPELGSIGGTILRRRLRTFHYEFYEC
jgi:hypothetical protein